MALYKEEERICRELGNKDSLALNLINQAILVKSENKIHKALALTEEAYELAIRHGFTALVQQKIKPKLDYIRSKACK